MLQVNRLFRVVVIFACTASIIMSFIPSSRNAEGTPSESLRSPINGDTTVYLPIVFRNPTPLPPFVGEIYVDANNTGDQDGSSEHPYNTIQLGINHAANNNVIIVRPGTYLENVVIPYSLTSRRLWLHGQNGASATIVDGRTLGSALKINSGNITVDGFTFQNGGGSSSLSEDGYGIVISLYGSNQTISAIIQNNVVKDNHLRAGIGVISNTLDETVNVRILSNRITGNSGGIYINFPGNVYGSVFIANNLIASNAGYCGGGMALAAEGSTFRTDVINNTIARNTAMFGGGICANMSNLSLINNILYSNIAYDTGTDLYLVQNALSAEVRFNIIGDGQYAGSNGNISLNPIFVDSPGGNYRLTSGSPAIDAGTTVAVYNDIDGNSRPVDGNVSNGAQWDIGAYEFR